MAPVGYLSSLSSRACCHWSFSCREWPNPVLLKQPEECNLNLPVWDPRVCKTHSFEVGLSFSAVLLENCCLEGRKQGETCPRLQLYTCCPTTSPE